MGDGDDEVRVTRQVSIPLRELTWRFTASGGPGGQHANTANTKVELRFDVEGSPSLGPVQRDRVIARLGPEIRIVVSDERSQARNRAVAIERFRAQLASALHVARTRVPTRPGRGAVQRRLDSKRRRSDVKRDRRPPESS